jgi:phosphoribosylamine--glycine ligase
VRVVVVGKGGREHALAQKLQQSSIVTELWVCPGNPGMEMFGISCQPIEKPDEIENFCVSNGVSLVVLGPEGAILSDLKERLALHKIFCFAPSPEGAKLESSKVFCKNILELAGIPTAQWKLCHNLAEAREKIQAHSFKNPLVLKVDGLAQGKGVWICESLEKALEGMKTLTEQFGFPLLIEECLVGKELSAFALCDGTDFVILGTACDYKRITSDPFSANTGGMGAFSPCDFLSPEDEKQIEKIFTKTLTVLKEKNMPYQGFLFAGLMRTDKEMSVLEFNARMGDPETQALLPRLESDLVQLILAAVKHELKGAQCRHSSSTTVHVVAASKGYPSAKMELGESISLPPLSENIAQVFFAGVSLNQKHLINCGGRVLGVTSLGDTKVEARTQAYQLLRKIHFKGMTYREDIGL